MWLKRIYAHLAGRRDGCPQGVTQPPGSPSNLVMRSAEGASRRAIQRGATDAARWTILPDARFAGSLRHEAGALGNPARLGSYGVTGFGA